MKFWMGFALYLLGTISGIVLWEKIDMKTVLKGKIMLKQRGRGNTQLTDIRPEINANTKRRDKKAARQEKREQRRSK